MKDILGKTYKQVTSLNFSNQQLKRIPREVFLCTNLRKLNLEGNCLKQIPKELFNLKKLKVLNLANNQLTSLQAGISQLSNLKKLVLANNSLRNIPKQIFNLKKLDTLMLQNNQLNKIECHILPERLYKLNLSNNNIRAINFIYSLENLKYLWIGGNSLSDSDIINLQTKTKVEKLYTYSSDNKLLNSSFSLNKKGNILDLKNKHQPFSKPVNEKTKIFISYSHKDIEWLERLQTHLKVLEFDNDRFSYWDDTKLRAGNKWNERINESIEEASIAILLVTTDFLASDFIRNNELPKLIKNVRYVLPLLVKPSMYTDIDCLKDIQAINPPEEVLSDCEESEVDRYFIKLTNRIKEII